MTKHKIGIASALTALALANATAAHAQAAQDGAAASDPAGEIIVTAQRRAEALERTPVAISVVSGDALAKRAIVTEATVGGQVRPPARLPQKWRLKDADWAAFTQGVEDALPGAAGRSADELHKTLTAAILQSARQHIGLSQAKTARKAHCWWTPAAAEALESEGDRRDGSAPRSRKAEQR